MFKKILLLVLSFFVLCGGYVNADMYKAGNDIISIDTGSVSINGVSSPCPTTSIGAIKNDGNGNYSIICQNTDYNEAIYNGHYIFRYQHYDIYLGVMNYYKYSNGEYSIYYNFPQTTLGFPRYTCFDGGTYFVLISPSYLYSSGGGCTQSYQLTPKYSMSGDFEEYNQNITLPTPINLKQYIESPYLYRQEIGTGTENGTKIGKYQSGSGIILRASIYDDKLVKLVAEIYKVGETTPIETLQSDYLSGFTGEVVIPYIGSGSYYWRVKSEDNLGNVSDWVDFGTNDIQEADYELFEGFEPYPYGYRFENNGPSDGRLDGGISGLDLLNIGTRKIIPGKKWNIFNDAFDLTGYNEVKLMDAFENLGLNKTDAFQGGNCYGLAVSSVMQFKHHDFLKTYFNSFSSQIGDGYIWDKINRPSTTSTGKWDIYNDISKAFYTLQLSQYSFNDRMILFNSFSSGTTILSNLSNNTSSGYIIGFLGKDKNGEVIGHAVVPYKVEGNKIYIWDNNIQYPIGEYHDIQYSAYSQYIEVNTDGTWTIPIYKNDFKSFDKIALINIDDLYNYGKKSGLSGFLGVDLKYTLNGTSDLIVTDSQGRISGFSGGTILEEIPGVDVIVPFNISSDGTSPKNTWKQIYLPQKQNLTVKVIAKGEENYDLMVAGGDYYTKLENVETSTGQIDTFVSKVDNLKIDFDDTKTGSYNLLTDNFQENNTGTIYIDSVPVIPNSQEYSIDWTKVKTNSNDAVIQKTDIDNDGIYDITIQLPPIFQDLLSPTTTVTLSGELLSNSTGTYIDTLNIDLSAIDNEGGTGIDKIYYAIGTDTGTLIYVPYTEPIIVNGVGNYTLNYYAIDKFGNTETTKTTNFSLVERPETYQGQISGYVYNDENNDGIQQSTEKLMAGWKICIDQNNNNDCEENNEPFNVTNNQGYYDFNGLASGTYKILEIPHQNWIVTNPTSKYYTITLSNGQKVTNNNFGNLKTKGK